MTPSKEREFLAGLNKWQKMIYLHVRDKHYGKINAITLPRLWDELHRHGLPDFADLSCADDLRRVCSSMPLCSSGEGVFYPSSAIEVQAFHHWLKSRAISLFERIRRVEDWHRELLEDRQMELPI